MRNNNGYKFQYSQCFEFIKPIHITEKLLLRLGFKKDEILYNKERFAIKKWEVGSEIGWVIFWLDKDILYVKPYYLHQLQNIYFSLTGEELEIKL